MRCEEGAVLASIVLPPAFRDAFGRSNQFPLGGDHVAERRHWHRSRRSVAWAAAFRTAVAPWPAVLRHNHWPAEAAGVSFVGAEIVLLTGTPGTAWSSREVRYAGGASSRLSAITQKRMHQRSRRNA